MYREGKRFHVTEEETPDGTPTRKQLYLPKRSSSNDDENDSLSDVWNEMCGERVVDERARHDSLENTLSAALTGTGRALTTACGFGVLALLLSPPLHRFGVVTGLSVVYAFVACVTVLSCLLVIRERILKRSA